MITKIAIVHLAAFSAAVGCAGPDPAGPGSSVGDIEIQVVYRRASQRNQVSPNEKASERLVIDADGGVRNAFAHIKGGAQVPLAASRGPLVLREKSGAFDPRVTGALEGTRIEFENLSNFNHVPMTLHKTGGSLELAVRVNSGTVLPANDTEPLVIRCDIHPSMIAFIWVLKHPYFAVSGERGTLRLAQIPVGTHEVEVWHEVLGRSSRTVTVRPGGTAKLDVVFGE